VADRTVYYLAIVIGLAVTLPLSNGLVWLPKYQSSLHTASVLAAVIRSALWEGRRCDASPRVARVGRAADQAVRH
jgi:uncharacterized membrane protein (DUF441 family)